MSAPPSEIARWHAHGDIVADKHPAIFRALVSILAAVIELIDAREAARGPLRAKEVLHAGRVLGIRVFTGRPGAWVLISTIPWLGLTDPTVRAQFLELHRRGEITLVRIEEPIMWQAREDLANRGQPPELIDQSAIVDGGKTYHAVLV